MAITWTIIVVGALLHGMQCNADVTTSATPNTVTLPTGPTETDSTKPTSSLTTFVSTKPNTVPTQTDTSTTAAPATSLEPATPATIRSSQGSTKLTTEAISTAQAAQSATSAHQELTTIPTSKTQTPNASPDPTAFKDSPQTSPTTVMPSETNQVTTNLNKTPTTITTGSGTTQLSPTPTSDVARNPTSSFTSSPGSKSMDSQSVGTTKAQTTAPITTPGPDPRTDKGTSTPQKPFNDSLDLINSTKMSIIREACEMLGQKVKGNCTVHIGGQGKTLTVTITIDADHEINQDIYKSQKPDSEHTDIISSDINDGNKGTIPDTLIAILASCGALVLILCCFAAYCTYHRRSYRKNQQHLTEELQTVENGYHDNPTLEVMEVQPEMQEKKTTLNGEFNDSWIVPIDNLLKEEIPDEEDTHL